MSTIRCIYSRAPAFPATDQHPDAVRYTVAGKVVDAIGGEPTAEEVAAFLAPSAQEAAEAAAHAEAKADSVVQYLRDHTLTEVAQFTRQQINADGVTNLATAQICLKSIEDMMVKQNAILAVLAKQNLR